MSRERSVSDVVAGCITVVRRRVDRPRGFGQHVLVTKALLTAVLLSTNAAGARERAVDLSAGVQVESVRDDLLVPLTFSGPGLSLSAGLRLPLGPGTLLTRLGFGFSVVFDRLGFFGGALRYGVDGTWLMPLGANVDLGLTLALDTRVNYFYRWDDAHSYWLGSQWLGPAVRVHRPLGAMQLSVLAQAAAIGFVGRPPALRFVKQEGVDRFAYYFSTPYLDERFVAVDQLQLVRLEATLTTASGWALLVQLRATATRVSAPTFALGASVGVSRALSW